MFWRRNKPNQTEGDEATRVNEEGLVDQPLGPEAGRALHSGSDLENPPDGEADVYNSATPTPNEARPAATSGPVPTEPEEAAPAQPVTQERIIEALRTVFDPEIPVNIYELGLIYGVLLSDSAQRPDGTDVDVKMTLTSPNCPVAETLPGDVARAVRTVTGVGEVDVEVVWDPTWNPDMMSEAAKLELGMF
jgi:FeS assembly SUF system protein